MPVTINGTTGIVTPALVNGTALAFRNKIINGNFSINQRVYVSGTSTSGANEYTLDRWRVVTSGQNVTFSASGNGNSVTAPTGGIEQVIEGANIEGGTYTLSWIGTATGAVNGSAVSNGGQVTLTANTNATIKFSSGTVSLVQLEEGSVATPFENRPIGTELALCQRYYELVSSSGTGAGALSWVGYGSGGGAIVTGFIQFKATKRSQPTIVVGSTFTTVNLSSQPFVYGFSEAGFSLSAGVVSTGQCSFTTSSPANVVTASAEF